MDITVTYPIELYKTSVELSISVVATPNYCLDLERA